MALMSHAYIYIIYIHCSSYIESLTNTQKQQYALRTVIFQTVFIQTRSSRCCWDQIVQFLLVLNVRLYHIKPSNYHVIPLEKHFTLFCLVTSKFHITIIHDVAIMVYIITVFEVIHVYRWDYIYPPLCGCLGRQNAAVLMVSSLWIPVKERHDSSISPKACPSSLKPGGGLVVLLYSQASWDYTGCCRQWVLLSHSSPTAQQFYFFSSPIYDPHRVHPYLFVSWGPFVAFALLEVVMFHRVFHKIHLTHVD
jgi:hypothetical protein